MGEPTGKFASYSSKSLLLFLLHKIPHVPAHNLHHPSRVLPPHSLYDTLCSLAGTCASSHLTTYMSWGYDGSWGSGLLNNGHMKLCLRTTLINSGNPGRKEGRKEGYCIPLTQHRMKITFWFQDTTNNKHLWWHTRSHHLNFLFSFSLPKRSEFLFPAWKAIKMASFFC